MDAEAREIIKHVFQVEDCEIQEVSQLKTGMTNTSFLFSCKGKLYIIRVPGVGTDKLISRSREAEVYNLIKELHISDEVIYINEKNGYKITEYFPETRVCNPNSKEDLEACMKVLKELHSQHIISKHRFDVFEQICFYEDLRQGIQSEYEDYEETKRHVFELEEYINKHKREERLSHMDAVSDNFLFFTKKGEAAHCRLIDWEYASMQDPDIDVAMFCLYAMFDRMQVDELIDIYFEGNCKKSLRIKIYCYIAAGGLLWSNWCEYKYMLGADFGEYALKQYEFAKTYYRIVQEELKNELSSETSNYNGSGNWK